MEKQIKIVSITHEELVDILSTATSANDWLGISRKKELGAIYNDEVIAAAKLKHEHENGSYCREDIWADILLNGGTLVAFDFYDEDEFGEVGKPYYITLEKVLKGLETAYTECPNNMVNVELFDGSADYYDANNVFQVIMFGEVIYG